MANRAPVFISYSHKDEEWLERLHTSLKPYIRQRAITLWDDRKLKAGDAWREEIQAATASARLAILLVTPNFLASDFIVENELPSLLGSCKIIWIPVRHSAYATTEIVRYQAAWDPRRPLASLDESKQDEALVEIAENIARAAEEAERPRQSEHSMPRKGPKRVRADTDALEFAPVVLRFRPAAASAFAVEVASRSEASQPAATLRLDPGKLQDRLWSSPQPVKNPRTGVDALLPSAADVQDVGARLYDALLHSELGPELATSLRGVEDWTRKRGLRFVIDASEAPEVARLPWEFAYNREKDDFIFRQALVPLVRRLDVGHALDSLAATPPIRLLVALASPSDQPDLMAGDEINRLEATLSELTEEGFVQPWLLEHTSREKLERELSERAPHILHYIGHGGFLDGRGVLFLESDDGQGQAAYLEGRDLADMLRTHQQLHGSLRLVFLNSCLGEATESEDHFGSLARGLVRQGIPAVVAMQFPISDRAAVALAEGFYGRLSHGAPVDAALSAARSSLSRKEVEWGAPALYMQTPDARLFDLEDAQRREPAQAVPAVGAAGAGSAWGDLTIEEPEPPETVAEDMPAAAAPVPPERKPGLEIRMSQPVAFAALLATAAVAGYLVLSRPASMESPLPALPRVSDEQMVREAPGIELPSIYESDPLVRALVGQLSDHPQLVKWLLPEELIRRFTVIVDEISLGISPRAHLEFLVPARGFSVRERAGSLVVSERAYSRYDVLAEVVGSVNAADAAHLYRSLAPLFYEAYRDLGYPDRDFDQTMARAISVIEETPVPATAPRVRRVSNYEYVDEELESLNAAQKDLLRMGPRNARIIQAKLSEFERELGLDVDYWSSSAGAGP